MHKLIFKYYSFSSLLVLLILNLRGMPKSMMKSLDSHRLKTLQEWIVWLTSKSLCIMHLWGLVVLYILYDFNNPSLWLWRQIAIATVIRFIYWAMNIALVGLGSYIINIWVVIDILTYIIHYITYNIILLYYII